MEGWKFWWGIAAFFLGGLATQLNGWLTYRRQRTDRLEDAAAAREQRRTDFELQHLQAAGEKLRAYREGFLNFAHTVQTAHAEAGPDGQAAAPGLEQAVDELDGLEADVHTHVGYIFDERVREAVIGASNTIERAITAALGDDTIEWRATNVVYKQAVDALAARVRQLYTGQAGP